jgi:hypothetical protein
MPFQPIAPGVNHTPPGAVASVGALTCPSPNQFPTRRTSVRFTAPTGMKVSWPSAMGVPGHIDVPGRYNFIQASLYRLKLSDIPGHPGVNLYPTLEVVPSNVKTEPFLAHSAVPVTFTNEDFDQVLSGNYVVKVIYLPDPQFQDLAAAGPDEVVSTRLEPGVNPIDEAQRRGSILLVVRIGNIDLELANSPALNAPGSHNGYPGGMCPPGMGANMPQMPASGMPQMPAMQPPATSGPVSKVPETTGIQQTSYQMSNGVTPAQLAGQSGSTAAKKPAPSTGWWGNSAEKK